MQKFDRGKRPPRHLRRDTVQNVLVDPDLIGLLLRGADSTEVLQRNLPRQPLQFKLPVAALLTRGVRARLDPGNSDDPVKPVVAYADLRRPRPVAGLLGRPENTDSGLGPVGLLEATTSGAPFRPGVEDRIP